MDNKEFFVNEINNRLIIQKEIKNLNEFIDLQKEDKIKEIKQHEKKSLNFISKEKENLIQALENCDNDKLNEILHQYNDMLK